jgi:hypothetical protein
MNHLSCQSPAAHVIPAEVGAWARNPRVEKERLIDTMNPERKDLFEQ